MLPVSLAIGFAIHLFFSQKLVPQCWLLCTLGSEHNLLSNTISTVFILLIVEGLEFFKFVQNDFRVKRRVII